MAVNVSASQPVNDPLAKRPLPRIGVFICECGDEVAGVLDVETLVDAATKVPDVAYAGSARYWCSADGRERLQETIRGERLERVVLAGCSPRTHQRLFRETATDAGLNPNLVRLVNIREGCAWPHREAPKAATVRARDQIGMEVAYATTLIPRSEFEAVINPAALVIGGGVTGMTAALDLAGAGVPVTLVERAPTLGGTDISQSPELATNLTAALKTHPGITIRLASHITQVDGSVGAYRVVTTDHGSRITNHGPFGIIIVATGAPNQETSELAKLLRLSQDVDGFLPEPRLRLRPGSFIERGIYVCGSAHYPCDTAEAQFQAYSAASRALHHLRRGKVTKHGPAAQVDPETCNGCTDCVKVCSFSAVTMAARSGGMSVSVIDPLLCTACGNCISICPVAAVTVADWTDAQLEAQMQVALNGALSSSPSPRPPVLVFSCEWSGYAAAELAGAQKLTYPSSVRVIRLDCAGRLQPGLILKAFEMGAAGVLVLGCEPKLCHYERGNEQAAAAFDQIEAITGMLGLSPNRLQLAWTPPDAGAAFAELVTRFVEGVEEAGMRSRK
jgi:heterodisulfide reductase subunit A-like polyferredoxin/coenzyme F420-reducing hydrogenase delta subunit